MENIISFKEESQVAVQESPKENVVAPQAEPTTQAEVAPIENVAPSVEPTPSVETAPTPQGTVIPNFEEEFVKKTNGRFKSVDEVLNLTQEYENKLKEIESKPKYANELVEKLNDFVSKGGDYKTFLKYQDLNLDSMDDLDVALEYYTTVENTGATREEIESFLVDQYKQGVDAEEFGFSQFQVNAGAFKLKSDAKRFREELSKLKAQNLEVAPKQTGLSQEEQQVIEAKQKLFTELQEASKHYKGFTVTTDDPEAKVSVNVEIDEPTASKISSIVENPENNIWQLFATKEGNFDKGKFIKAVHILQNPEKFEKVIASNAFAQGVQSVIAQTKNATIPSNTIQAPSESNNNDFKQNQEALLRQLGLNY